KKMVSTSLHLCDRNHIKVLIDYIVIPCKNVATGIGNFYIVTILLSIRKRQVSSNTRTSRVGLRCYNRCDSTGRKNRILNSNREKDNVIQRRKRKFIPGRNMITIRKLCLTESNRINGKTGLSL